MLHMDWKQLRILYVTVKQSLLLRVRMNKNNAMKYYQLILPNQKHPWCKKSCGQELKKGLDKKEVKSKWAAKACVVLLLIKIKF